MLSYKNVEFFIFIWWLYFNFWDSSRLLLSTLVMLLETIQNTKGQI